MVKVIKLKKGIKQKITVKQKEKKVNKINTEKFCKRKIVCKCLIFIRMSVDATID